MHRPIRDRRLDAPPSAGLEPYAGVPPELVYPVPAGFAVKVAAGRRVEAGEALAGGANCDIHTAMRGSVLSADEGRIRIGPDADAVWPPLAAAAGTVGPPPAEFPAFASRIGLRGMGGSQFPAAVKWRASMGVGTLVVNAAECEPGATVDRSILQHEPDLLRLGAEAIARAVGASRIVIALRRHRDLEKAIRALYPFERLPLPDRYPAGNERLILEALTGRRPPAGVLPFRVGALVQNVASVRAVGRALRDGVPVVERPLTLIAHNGALHRDLVVPIGIRIGDLLSFCGIVPAPGETIITGGLMMGEAVCADTPVTAGTTAVYVLPWAAEKPRGCIRCGACCDACPLGLHPIALVEALNAGRTSRAASAQLADCFLCGACSAVCPARLPLSADLRRAKQAAASRLMTPAGSGA